MPISDFTILRIDTRAGAVMWYTYILYYNIVYEGNKLNLKKNNNNNNVHLHLEIKNYT